MSLISTHLSIVFFIKIGFIVVKRYAKISLSYFVKSKELILNKTIHSTGHNMKLSLSFLVNHDFADTSRNIETLIYAAVNDNALHKFLLLK